MAQAEAAWGESGQLCGQGLWPIVEGTSQPRGPSKGVNPTISFPPFSHGDFSLGEPTQKPEAWSSVQSIEINLQDPRQVGEWIWKGKQETFLILSFRNQGVLRIHSP